MKHQNSLRVACVLVFASALGAARAQDDVQDLADRWTEAYNTHDREAIASLYAEDAELMMHGSPTIEGRDAIGTFWAEDFKAGNPITVLNVTHSVDGADMVLVHGDYQVIDRETGLPLGAGRFAHIWRAAGNDGWELDRDLWLEPLDPFGDAASSAELSRE